MFPELKRLIEQMGKDRGIDREIIVKALEDAMLTAAHKKLGADVELEAHYNEEAGEIEVFQFKTVMEKVLDPDLHISIAEARRTLDEEAEPGDSLGIKIETSTFGRIAVQTAKQIIIQRVKDAERDNIYEEYHVKKGELANGFVQRFEGGNIIVNLGRAEGIIPISEQIFKESYKRGERIRAFICEVKKITKGPQIILSRTHPGFLKALFEVEVPEISEGSDRDCERVAGSGEKVEDLGQDPGQGYRSRRRLRRHERRPRSERRPGTQGGEDRYRPLFRRSGQVCLQCLVAGKSEPGFGG